MINKVIMVVDDESEMVKLLAVTLKQYGFAVMKAPNADVALQVARSFTPSLFILDLLMPRMDGIELCRHLRANPNTSQVPVIIFTAYDSWRNRQRAQEAGADAFVQKNGSATALIEKIQALLSKHDVFQ
jgi:DNA-binding response OmpR family regulator